MRFAIFSFVLAACGACSTTTQPGPIVKLVYDQTEVPSDVQAWTNAGADAWASLGITGGPATVGTRDENRECISTWFDGTQPLPCTVTVHVTFVPKSELGGAAGLTSGKRTMLAIELSGDQLIAVAAHEVGHTIFATSQHLAPGDVGIMAAAPSSPTPTDADVAFAVAHTQGWVSP